MAEGDKPASGWVDLCLTFADAGLSVPPVPEGHRELLIKQHDWFWSTRPDVDSFQMYMFEYVKELLTGSVSDYSAISHQGHGVNSYGLNVSIVQGRLAIIFQHGWGGVYSNPMKDLTDITACFFQMRELLEVSVVDPDREGLAHILAWSSFRGVAEYYAKNQGHWVREDRTGRRPRVRSDADDRRAVDRFPPEKDLGAACRRFLDILTDE